MRDRLYLVVVVLAILAGVALRWEALAGGFTSDDYAQIAMLRDAYPVERHPLDLFSFSHGDPDEIQALMDDGFYPWWTHPELRLTMLRPLACVLMWFDLAMFGTNPLPYHLHNMLWWVVLVLVVATLYRKLLPRPVAAVAIVLFALDESHGLPVMWIANRSALLTLTLVLLGLVAYIRWRRDRWRYGGVLSVLCFSLAVASGEWSIASLAYVLAYELHARDKPMLERACHFLVAAIPALVYVSVRSALHYGAQHSDIYLDPFSDPAFFVVESSKRIPVFFAELVFGIPAAWWLLGTPWRVFYLGLDVFPIEVWRELPSWQFWHLNFGVLGAVLGGWLARWAFRTYRGETGHALAWLLTGALLSLTPMVGSFSSSRLVLPASVGVSALLGAVIVQGLRTVRAQMAGRWIRSTVIALGTLWLTYIHVWHAGVRSAWEMHGDIFQTTSAYDWIMLSDVDDAVVENQRLVVIGARDHNTALYLPLVRWVHGRPRPRSCWLLSAVARAHDVTRVADDTIDLMPLGDPLLANTFETLFRAERYGMGLGETVELDGLTATVVQMAGDKPLRVRFRFENSIDDPMYLFLYSTEDGLRRVEMPRIGERLRLPKPIVPNRFLLPQFRPRDDPTSELYDPDRDSERGSTGHVDPDLGDS